MSESQSCSNAPFMAAPPPLNENNDYTRLPDGWTTRVDPHDGRMFYWERATGRTSWTHPLAPSLPPEKDGLMRTDNSRTTGRTISQQELLPHQENPLHASRKPDTHECQSFLALCCCPIIGLLAMYHSCSVNRAWENGRYGDAVNHARQAPKYATLAIIVGIVFWMSGRTGTLEIDDPCDFIPIFVGDALTPGFEPWDLASKREREFLWKCRQTHAITTESFYESPKGISEG